MNELERLAEGIRRADQAGDAEAVRALGARYRELQNATKPEGMSGGSMTMQALAGPTLAIASDPLGYARNLAGEAAQMGATGLGIAMGAPAGIPGMMIGGGVGASAGARAKQLLRGDPEPTTGEKATQTGIGAASGMVGGLVSKALQQAPVPRLSYEMQSKAKALAEMHRSAAKAAGQAIQGRGFKGVPEAAELWKNSQVVQAIENALRTSRNNPDRIREQIARLLQNNKLMARLTPEQQALIQDVAHQNTAAGAMRALGDLRNTFMGGVGGSLISDPLTGGMVAAGQVATGQAGAAIDRYLTEKLVARALQGVSGMTPPTAQPNITAALLSGVPASEVLNRGSSYLARQ